MKWIGQHIWDFISRFRSDVYLESVDSGTIASGGNLGLDSNNKIVKATTVGSATLASTVTVTDSTASTNFPIVFHDESNSLLDDTGTFTYNPGAGTFEFSTSGVSAFFLNNSGINAVSGQMYLQNKRNGGAGSINDNTGKIVFQGQNSNSETISFAAIVTSIEDETDGDEAGEMVIQVAASNDSTSQLRQALTATGHGTDDKVDIGLGYGAASLTTVAGSLTVTSDLTVSGTTTTINTTNLNVEDKNIILNYNASGDTSGTADGAGITIQDAVDASNDASLTWVAASDKFGFSHAVDITNGASGGVAALTIDNDDVDVNALLIEAANTTEHILDIEAGALTTADAIHVKADALTTGAAINLDINDSLTTSAIKSLIKIDYDKSGVTASGQTSMTAGLEIDMADSATNDAGGTVSFYGATITLDAASDQGGIQQTGLYLSLTDADTGNKSTGIYSLVEDGGEDFKAVSSADTGDYFSIATTAHGATTLTTVDDDATAAHFTVDADGDIILDAGSKNVYTAFNGTNIFQFDMNGPTMKIMSPDDTGDYFSIATTDHGATTISTVDDDATAGDLTFDIDGEIVLDAHTGEDIFFKENGTERFHFHLDSTPTMEVTGNFDINGSGDITLDAAADIELNADNGTINLKDGTTLMGSFTANGYKGDREMSPGAGLSFGETKGDILYFGSGSTTQAKLCYLKEDGSWGQADADGVATGDDADRDAMGMLAIALGTDPDVDGMLIRGMISMGYDLGDVGNPLYVSTSPGGITNTAPSGANQFVRVVGYCLDDSGSGKMYFNPDNTWVEIA